MIQSWDTANKPTELADYSVCTTWGVKGPRFYLLDVLRKKLSYPELKRAVIEQDRLFRPETIVIEDRASGTQLIQDLIDAGISHVARYAPDGDKIMRLHAQSATIENGFVFLPDAAPWLADYLSELTAFPAGRHDDQVDSTAQVLAWAKRRTGAEGWSAFYGRRRGRGRQSLLPSGEGGGRSPPDEGRAPHQGSPARVGLYDRSPSSGRAYARVTPPLPACRR